MPQAITPITPDDGLTTAARRQRGVVIVNTGDGKGKTTAAFGTALRGWHQGWRIGVFQFVKSGRWHSGEQHALEVLGASGEGGSVDWHIMGSGWSWARSKGSGDDRAALARQGWDEVARRLADQTHDLYVLDEFTYPMARGWVDAGEVASTLATRPGRQHVIITGRGCPTQIIDIADLVTDMTKVKHPFDQGQRGQRGIEW